MLDVVEILSAADGSTGWVTMILNGAFMLAWIDLASAKQLVARVHYGLEDDALTM